MRRFLTSCLLIVTLALSTSTLHAHDWTETVRKVAASTVRLAHRVQVMNPFTGQVVEVDTACSGFVINQKRGYVLTASHCLNEGTTEQLTIKGVKGPVWLILNSPELDIAVIATTMNKPAVRPSRQVVSQGQMVGALGFGYGFQRPLFRGGYVSNTGVDVDPEIPGLWALFDGPFIGGMSGGPVFNHKGEIVGVVQMSNEIMGLWRPFSQVFAATRTYWG